MEKIQIFNKIKHLQKDRITPDNDDNDDKNIRYFKEKEIFPELKIYGYSQVEDAILSGLVTGDPVLLIGRHGTAKTMLAEAIAYSLNLKFIAYDASKALFDDVIGFPNPQSLREGTIEYTPTPLSIWDKEFILIDEISRAMPSMQNKWLEIIRSRSVMGKKINSLKYIFAAMNPVGEYVGAMPLDLALLGRFAFIVRVPEVYDMLPEEINKIINNLSHDDAIAMKSLHKNNNVKSENLLQVINTARELFQIIQENYKNIIIPYIYNLMQELIQSQRYIDGRRLGMLNRNIIAYLSVVTAKHGKEYTKDNLFSLIYNCIRHSLPFAATEEAKDIDTILPLIHQKVVSIIESPMKAKLFKTFKSSSGTKAKHFQLIVKNLIFNYDNLDEHEKCQIVSNLTLTQDDLNEEKLADFAIAIKKLLKFLLSKDEAEHEIITKVAQIYTSMTSITSAVRNASCYHLPFASNRSQTLLRISLDEIETDIAYRYIINLPYEEQSRFLNTNNTVNNKFFNNLRSLLKKNYPE
ncbi:MAG: MoxR family ATPase [Endomicrobiia bacterium]